MRKLFTLFSCLLIIRWGEKKKLNDNLPVLLAGGGFKHTGHLAFDKKKNYPLSNLYVSLLQSLGVEASSFRSGTGAMRGIDLA
ncbi:hypothetical protein OAE01_02150 [Akkermansiaceae bacterium]|nr:hypothetical protein [Akkermansiaceae bacterium]MDA7919551.1 hypothetical protein [Akkermansiaceae bacterium]MDA8973411.1 hypothetical protein [Akkermansiaceae bacterium]MDA8974674.1 hypothetical protein [Akkermansiaceae bacterium]MDA9197121.1 hypothetical protein [Akkermansiaceae bacterium]